MTPDERDEQRKEAYAALEVAIDLLARLDNDSGEVPVDAVLIIGSQYICDDGDRSGYVTIHPHSGWAPPYITAGLLTMALSRVTAPHQVSLNLPDDDA